MYSWVANLSRVSFYRTAYRESERRKIDDKDSFELRLCLDSWKSIFLIYKSPFYFFFLSSRESRKFRKKKTIPLLVETNSHKIRRVPIFTLLIFITYTRVMFIISHRTLLATTIYIVCDVCSWPWQESYASST